MFGGSVLTTAKCVGGLQKFSESVFTPAKHGEWLWTSANRVEGLQKIGESVLTTAERV